MANTTSIKDSSAHDSKNTPDNKHFKESVELQQWVQT